MTFPYSIGIPDRRSPESIEVCCEFDEYARRTRRAGYLEPRPSELPSGPCETASPSGSTSKTSQAEPEPGTVNFLRWGCPAGRHAARERGTSPPTTNRASATGRSSPGRSVDSPAIVLLPHRPRNAASAFGSASAACGGGGTLRGTTCAPSQRPSRSSIKRYGHMLELRPQAGPVRSTTSSPAPRASAAWSCPAGSTRIRSARSRWRSTGA